MTSDRLACDRCDSEPICGVRWSQPVTCCVLLQTRTERDAKRMHELESRIQAENARNKSLNDELIALKVRVDK